MSLQTAHTPTPIYFTWSSLHPFLSHPTTQATLPRPVLRHLRFPGLITGMAYLWKIRFQIQCRLRSRFRFLCRCRLRLWVVRRQIPTDRLGYENLLMNTWVALQHAFVPPHFEYEASVVGSYCELENCGVQIVLFLLSALPHWYAVKCYTLCMCRRCTVMNAVMVFSGWGATYALSISTSACLSASLWKYWRGGAMSCE